MDGVGLVRPLVSRRPRPPISDMGLMISVAAASFACLYMLFVLHFCRETRKSTSGSEDKQRTASNASVSAEKRNRQSGKRCGTDAPEGTGELRLSREPAVKSDTSHSEILVRQRMVQILAVRVAQRREK